MPELLNWAIDIFFLVVLPIVAIALAIRDERRRRGGRK